MADAAENQPATASEVMTIIGRADDAVIAAIMRTGATRDEVMEAHTWLSADDYLHRERHSALRGRAAEVYRILEAEQAPSRDEP
jgi:hypothetical protein